MPVFNGFFPDKRGYKQSEMVNNHFPGQPQKQIQTTYFNALMNQCSIEFGYCSVIFLTFVDTLTVGKFTNYNSSVIAFMD